jgi:hypothetical protein
VQHNRESRTLQYAMRDRLALLGWSEIEVIDEDLGRSAAGGGHRAPGSRSATAEPATARPKLSEGSPTELVVAVPGDLDQS